MPGIVPNILGVIEKEMNKALLPWTLHSSGRFKPIHVGEI
jgi:hypothetical protein